MCVGMAKAAKKATIDIEAGKPANSYLAAAYHCFDAGDKVRTRQFAQQVLDGHATPADPEAAKYLSAMLSTAGHPVKELPEDVAAELISRTKVPLKPFAFTLLASGIFVLLVTLALTRYGA